MSYIPPNPNGQATSANSAPVVIASDQSAVPVSAASLPLPTGAATAAKQPALGTAGTPSADVISVQGVAGGVAVPVSGTVTATASGDTTVVGKAASGAAATGNPVLMAGSDGTNARTILTDNAGRQVVKSAASTTATGTITASGQSVTAALSGIEATVSVMFYGTFSNLSWGAEYSPDGGTSWGPTLGYYQGVSTVTATANSSFALVSATAAATTAYTVVVPTGATHVRVRSTALTSGTVNVVIGPDVVARPQTGAYAVDTELPTAGTLADSGGNPSTTGVSAYNLTFNGTTWDRQRHDGTTGGVGVGGTVASGATDAGNPVKVGAVGRTANPTAVSDGQRVNLTADKLGKLVTVGSIREQKGRQVTTITSSTAETTIVTAVASTFCDLYGLVLSNTSATATEVTIRDATAGGTVSSFMVPAGETRGFMLPESAAWPQATANNNWTATCGTSVASLKVTALFVKNT